MSDPGARKPPFSKENPQPRTKKVKASPPPNPWDRPPRPSQGDEDVAGIHQAVGNALSAWEGYEGILASLFACMVTTGKDLDTARRAFSAVRTHEGRMTMLQVAAESFFDFYPDEEAYATLKILFRVDQKWTERRNELAHGTVHHLSHFAEDEGKEVEGYGLVPSYSHAKMWTLNREPAYIYVSKDIGRVAFHITRLRESARKIVEVVEKHRSSLGTPPPQESGH